MNFFLLIFPSSFTTSLKNPSMSGATPPPSTHRSPATVCVQATDRMRMSAAKMDGIRPWLASASFTFIFSCSSRLGPASATSKARAPTTFGKENPLGATFRNTW